MQISPIMYQIWQSRLNILRNNNYLSKTVKVLPKWRNFAKTGHTASNQRWFSIRFLSLSIVLTENYSAPTANLIVKGSGNNSGCGSVGRVAASNSRGPRFESSHRQKIMHWTFIYCQLYWKDENKGKRGLEWPIQKIIAFAAFLALIVFSPATNDLFGTILRT